MKIIIIVSYYYFFKGGHLEMGVTRLNIFHIIYIFRRLTKRENKIVSKETIRGNYKINGTKEKKNTY